MLGTTTVADIFTAVVGALDKAGVNWFRIDSLATDGAPSRIGKQASVVQNVREKVQTPNGGRDFWIFYCILYQEALRLSH